MDVLKAINSLEDDVLKHKCLKAVAAVQRTVDLYRSCGTAFSFNGGKDSTVLLHLIRAAVAEDQTVDADHINPVDAACGSGDAPTMLAGSEQPLRNASSTNGAAPAAHDSASIPSSSGCSKASAADGPVQSASCGLGGMRTFVFHRNDDFREILDFTRDMDAKYGLRLEVLSGDFKHGLEGLVGSGVKAIFLGTRRGDPNAEGQEFFSPSSVGWPPFMRVNPILDWTYTDVWAFLRASHAPYCALYDRGYTSIGSINNTQPNSSLEKEDGTFAPAHVLADGRLERAGRTTTRPQLGRTFTISALTCTAGLLIIGDEILAAKVDDTNTRFLCAELRQIGWRVKKVLIVPDDVADIAASVHALSEEMDLVITSGGVGPTPDDVTMAGVAAAFDTKLSRDPELEHRLREYFGDDLTSAHLKMAEVPEGECELIDHSFDSGHVSPFSLPHCRNVYVLPGVPHLLQKKWRTLREHLLKGGGPASPFRNIVLRLNIVDETIVAPALHQLQANMPDRLGWGSYPLTDQPDGAGIALSLESKDTAILQAAHDFLQRELPPGTVAAVERDSKHYSNGPSPQDGRP